MVLNDCWLLVEIQRDDIHGTFALQSERFRHSSKLGCNTGRQQHHLVEYLTYNHYCHLCIARCGLTSCILVLDKASGQPKMRPKLERSDSAIPATPITPAVQAELKFSFNDPNVREEPIVISTLASQHLSRGLNGEVCFAVVDSFAFV